MRGRLRAVRAGRRGVTLLELLVVISVIGAMVALILPAVMSARTQARALRCKSRLWNLGRAMVGYAAAHGRFPASGNYAADRADRFHGWPLELMSRLDHASVQRAWNRAEPFDSAGNRTVGRTAVEVLVCPDDDSLVEGRGNLSYVVNGGIGWTIPTDCPAAIPVQVPADGRSITARPIDLDGDGRTCQTPSAASTAADDRVLLKRLGFFFPENLPLGRGTVRHHSLDSMTDGASQTVMMSENLRAGVVADQPTSGWADPDPLRNSFFFSSAVCRNARCDPGAVDYANANRRDQSPAARQSINASRHQPEGQAPWPSSRHPGGVHVVFADGHVRVLAQRIDGAVYAALLSPQGVHIDGPLAQQPGSANGF